MSDLVPTTRTLIDIEEDLKKASKDYECKKRTASQARNEETSALNRVNKLQAELDRYIEELKRRAEYGTDWAHARNRNRDRE